VETGDIDYHTDWDAHQHFGTVGRSMWTLFETCIEPLNFRPVVMRQPYLFPVLLAFIFMTTFGVMNVIVGALVQQHMDTNKLVTQTSAQNQWRDKTRKILDSVFFIDENRDGFVTLQELYQGLHESHVLESMKALDLPLAMSEEEMLDLVAGLGEDRISMQMMVRSFARTVDNEDRRHVLELKASVNQLTSLLNISLEANQSLDVKLNTLQGCMKSRLAELDQQTQSIQRGVGSILDQLLLQKGITDDTREPGMASRNNLSLPVSYDPLCLPVSGKILGQLFVHQAVTNDALELRAAARASTKYSSHLFRRPSTKRSQGSRTPRGTLPKDASCTDLADRSAISRSHVSGVRPPSLPSAYCVPVACCTMRCRTRSPSTSLCRADESQLPMLPQ